MNEFDGIENNEGQDTSPEVKQEEKSSVDFDAYKNVRSDMFKYKDRARSLEQELAQLRADAEAREQAELERQKNYEELYQREKNARESLKSEVDAERARLQRSQKLHAVRAELPLKKPEYAEKFIDLDAISIGEDGTPDRNSVAEAVEFFKREYPELLSNVGPRSLPATAPKPTNRPDPNDVGFKEFASMSPDQRKLWIAQQIKARK